MSGIAANTRGNRCTACYCIPVKHSHSSTPCARVFHGIPSAGSEQTLSLLVCVLCTVGEVWLHALQWRGVRVGTFTYHPLSVP